VAAVALETWAEARRRGEETRAWAASQLGLAAADTPLVKVGETAMERLAHLKEEHRELIRSWERLSPAPTRAQIERRLAGMEPGAAAVARTAVAELNERPAAATPGAPPRPELTLAQPALAR
jgi:hypothetical protein